MRDEFARSLEPARRLAAEAAKLEHEISDLVNDAYGLTPDEIALLWATTLPRMPIPAQGAGKRHLKLPNTRSFTSVANENDSLPVT